MFIVGLASLVVGYAIAYYGIDAMSHYDSSSKTTKGLPLFATLGIPGGDASQTATVFAKWGTASASPAGGAPAPQASPNPNSTPLGPVPIPGVSTI